MMRCTDFFSFEELRARILVDISKTQASWLEFRCDMIPEDQECGDGTPLPQDIVETFSLRQGHLWWC